MSDPGALLADARRRLDADPALVASAHASFGGGAEWMRRALGSLRDGAVPSGRAPFQRIGVTKYAAALAAAAVPCAVAVASRSAWPLLLVVPAFYAVEVQGAFVFPCALDGAPRPFAASRSLVVRAGGTLRAMATVLPIAAAMLAGGFLGRGFRRSWCTGCLAVLLWYEGLEGRRP